MRAFNWNIFISAACDVLTHTHDSMCRCINTSCIHTNTHSHMNTYCSVHILSPSIHPSIHPSSACYAHTHINPLLGYTGLIPEAVRRLLNIQSTTCGGSENEDSLFGPRLLSISTQTPMKDLIAIVIGIQRCLLRAKGFRFRVPEGSGPGILFWTHQQKQKQHPKP